MWIDIDREGAFELEPSFVERYRERPVPWGFGALSWVTYKRSYSRDGESWWQTCRRVVEGMYTVQRAHQRMHGLGWDAAAAQARAREAYARMWGFKWTPPGRGLWIMGTRFLYDRGSAALNNCGFVSTADIDVDYAAPFVWMLEMSMLGVGIGFDTRGAGHARIGRAERSKEPHVIEDSREGWCAAIARLLRAYSGRASLPALWDYSAIRQRGMPLSSFGGRASGPKALQELLESLESLYSRYVDRSVDSTLIVDTMNLIARCVVAGGVRRSAQIALGDPSDDAFLRLKRDAAALASHRWASNNSVFAELGMDYSELTEHTSANGEPGYLWLENARRFGRMVDPPNDADQKALGCNPCAEQTLWDRELCCLVETYPAHHASFSDFRRTLEVAVEYAKTVTLMPTHDGLTNRVMQRNRRIGCSLTGVVQAIERHGYRSLLDWCDRGYAAVRERDRTLSAQWGIPTSIKLTSVKPSGTVSLLAGATPGVHWSHAPFYLRRLRVTQGSSLVDLCRDAGFEVETDVHTPGTDVIAFPVHVAHLTRTSAQVSLREKIDLAAQLQRFWSDNQVSCTLDFDPQTERSELAQVLECYEDRLKGISLLPRHGHGYAQPPYEELSPEEYERRRSRLRPIRVPPEHEELLEAAFCDGVSCEAPLSPHRND